MIKESSRTKKKLWRSLNNMLLSNFPMICKLKSISKRDLTSKRRLVKTLLDKMHYLMHYMNLIEDCLRMQMLLQALAPLLRTNDC